MSHVTRAGAGERKGSNTSAAGSCTNPGEWEVISDDGKGGGGEERGEGGGGKDETRVQVKIPGNSQKSAV